LLPTTYHAAIFSTSLAVTINGTSLLPAHVEQAKAAGLPAVLPGEDWLYQDVEEDYHPFILIVTSFFVSCTIF